MTEVKGGEEEETDRAASVRCLGDLVKLYRREEEEEAARLM